MEKLPYQLKILNDFIWEKPQVVVSILKNNGIKVSSKPTLPEIIRKSVQAIDDDNEKFVREVYGAMQNEGEASFDPITLGVSAVFSIGSAIMGARQAKKNRQAQMNMKLMELASNEKLTFAEIQAMKEQGRIEIMTNTILAYGQSLQSESTKRQKDTALFIGIMGVGIAVVYATIQIFKK